MKVPLTVTFHICLVFCISARSVNSCNILGVLAYPGNSHAVSFLPIFEALAQRGHNVTVISYFPRKSPLPNYHDIDLIGNLSATRNAYDIGYYNPELRKTKYLNPVKLQELMRKSCDAGLNSPEFQDFKRSGSTFDVILMEYFKGDCFLGLTKKFKAPVIGLSSCTLMPWSSERFGNPTHTAYIPNNFMPFSDRMNFFERLENTIVNTFHVLQHNYFDAREDEAIVEKHFGMKPEELRKQIFDSEILLTNTHFSLNLPRPLVPNIIEIGGIHIREPKILPQYLETWISESKDGVVYFSLGSLLKGHTLPKKKKDAFLKAFARLPQRFIMKWENGTMDNKPDNVMVQEWLPQSDIISHPNVKAFISHGGLMGTIEAVHYGVPVIVMPQFGDQHTNAKALEANGGGIILEFGDVTEDNVFESLQTVLTDSFRMKAKKLSERFRDRPMPPLETAVYWVEYVLRHKGASHMRTAAVDMPFYQYYLLDVFCFIFLIIGSALYLMYVLCKSVLNLFNRSTAKIKSS